MKKGRRKYISCQLNRDLWDNSKIYWFGHLSVDRIKFKLSHLPKKDRQMREKLKEVLKWRTRKHE